MKQLISGRRLAGSSSRMVYAVFGQVYSVFHFVAPRAAGSVPHC